MAPEPPLPLNEDELIRRYLAGESCQQIGESLGVSDEVVRNRLIKAGVPRRGDGEKVMPERVHVDSAAIVARYQAGESEKALAEVFGISRTAIRRRLLKAGVEPRGRSDAMYERMSQMTPEERAALADAAHAAARGKPKTPEFLIAKALGVERKGADGGNVSDSERIFAGMLRDAGRDVIHQKAIGPYNVDIATGAVAVEILGGGWHRTKNHRERLRYILDAGWDVIYIWVDGRRFPLCPGAAEYVIAHCEFRDRNPTAARCYRVIRGGGQFVAEGSADGDDIPDILPITDRPDVEPSKVPFGYCHCGCGQRTRIAPQTDRERGWIKGQPIRYRTGHNSNGHRYTG